MLSVWQKITGLLSLIAGFFYLKSKIQKNKIDELEGHNRALEKKEQITEYMEEVKINEEIRERLEIERKAQITRDASNEDLNNIINNL